MPLIVQATRPGGHDVQCPCTHAPTAFPKAHTTPHAPQFCGSVAVSEQMREGRLIRGSWQSSWPEAQLSCAGTQLPLVHVLEAGQALPQPPQFVAEVTRFTQPPLQLVSGGEQPTAQTPSVHVAPPVHALPQAPQLALSWRMLISQPSDAVWLQSANPAVH
jgi:hypothetical protein